MRDARDRRHAGSCPAACNVIEPGRIGLQGQVDQVEQQPVRPIEVGGVGECPAAAWTSTLGLGFLAQSSALASRCSSSRTLVKYSSSLSRSSAPRRLAALGLVADRIENALAIVADAAPGPATSSGRPSRNNLANTLDGENYRTAPGRRCGSRTG